VRQTDTTGAPPGFSPMRDVLSREQRAYCMSRIRRTNTQPELLLRRALWAGDLRYRLRSDLPGHPDLHFPRARVAVFVDGCFWHGCPAHQVMPHTHRRFWRKKLQDNRSRDRRVNRELRFRGWTVLRFWEHVIGTDLAGAVERVQMAVGKEVSSARHKGSRPLRRPRTHQLQVGRGP
jgi:DNA mismatch endonuclease (patch repair protein)